MHRNTIVSLYHCILHTIEYLPPLILLFDLDFTNLSHFIFTWNVIVNGLIATAYDTMDHSMNYVALAYGFDYQ